MMQPNLPPEIEVYEIGARRLYIKTGDRNFAISEDDVTPEELVAIARHIAARQPITRRTQIAMAVVSGCDARRSWASTGSAQAAP